jgi:hypothetical protein
VQFDSEAIAEAQSVASVGCPEVLRILLQLGIPDQVKLLDTIISNGNIRCIKVAIYARIAIEAPTSAEFIASRGTIQLYALAREMGYQVPDRSREVQPERFRILERLVEDFRRKECPEESKVEYLGHLPRMGLLDNVVSVLVSQARQKAKAAAGPVPMEDNADTAIGPSPG